MGDYQVIPIIRHGQIVDFIVNALPKQDSGGQSPECDRAALSLDTPFHTPADSSAPCAPSAGLIDQLSNEVRT